MASGVGRRVGAAGIVLADVVAPDGDWVAHVCARTWQAGGVGDIRRAPQTGVETCRHTWPHTPWEDNRVLEYFWRYRGLQCKNILYFWHIGVDRVYVVSDLKSKHKTSV